MLNPKLPLDPSVPISLWRDVAEAVSIEFADSYLSRAKVHNFAVTPHTTIAFDRLMGKRDAMKVITEAGFKLIRPLPFGHPDRPDTPSGTAPAMLTSRRALADQR